MHSFLTVCYKTVQFPHRMLQNSAQIPHRTLQNSAQFQGRPIVQATVMWQANDEKIEKKKKKMKKKERKNNIIWNTQNPLVSLRKRYVQGLLSFRIARSTLKTASHALWPRTCTWPLKWLSLNSSLYLWLWTWAAKKTETWTITHHWG